LKSLILTVQAFTIGIAIDVKEVLDMAIKATGVEKSKYK
jgi:hypothetical protein